jgi:hypothetical protein
MPIIDIRSRKNRIAKLATRTALTLLAAAIIAPSAAWAGEAEAKAMLKAMTDYMSAQKDLAFRYDASMDVVSKDGEKLQIAYSGRVVLARPDRLAATRSGGFADIETIFDGKTLTILGKNKNLYLQLPVPGSVDQLVDVMHHQYNRPLPAADLVLTNAYSELMTDVTEAKDLGSGVIGGTECDHLAFRGKEVDWQIWIAQGSRPLPCRYVITSKQIAGYPCYTITMGDWQTSGAPDGTFVFKTPAGAKQITLEELKAMKDMADLPSNFIQGGGKQ